MSFPKQQCFTSFTYATNIKTVFKNHNWKKIGKSLNRSYHETISSHDCVVFFFKRNIKLNEIMPTNKSLPLDLTCIEVPH